MLNLIDLFNTLQPPARAGGDGLRFTAQPIPGYESHRLGKDEHGAPSLLLAVSKNATIPRPAGPFPLALVRCASKPI